MKVGITGCCGYLGSHCLQRWLGNGITIWGIDTFRHEDYGAAFHLPNQFEKIDARDVKAVANYFKHVDCVIPLAGLVGEKICRENPEEAWAVNYEAVIKLAEAMPDKLIIFPMTSSGYGDAHGNLCDETVEQKPVSVYGETKVEAEKYLLERDNTIIFRLATVYGVSPRMRFDLLVNDFVARLVQDEKLEVYESQYKRSIVHIGDVVTMFQAAIYHDALFSQKLYNIASPNEKFTKIQLAESIRNILQSEKPVIVGRGKDIDQRNYWLSSERLIVDYGHNPFSPNTFPATIRQLAHLVKVLPSDVISKMRN